MLQINHPQSIGSDGTVGEIIKSGEPPKGNKSTNGAGEGANGAEESANGVEEGDGGGTNGSSNGVKEGTKAKPVVNGVSKAVDKPLSDSEKNLATAYKELYDAQNAVPPNPITTRAKQDALQVALEANG